MSDAPDLDSPRSLREALGFPAVDVSAERRRPRRPASPDALIVVDPAAEPASGDGGLEGLSIRLDELVERMTALEQSVARIVGRLDGGALDSVARTTAASTAQGMTAVLRQELVSFSDRLTEALRTEQAGAEDERPPRGR